jgi:hypothetical protein
MTVKAMHEKQLSLSFEQKQGDVLATPMPHQAQYHGRICQSTPLCEHSAVA